MSRNCCACVGECVCVCLCECVCGRVPVIKATRSTHSTGRRARLTQLWLRLALALHRQTDCPGWHASCTGGGNPANPFVSLNFKWYRNSICENYSLVFPANNTIFLTLSLFIVALCVVLAFFSSSFIHDLLGLYGLIYWKLYPCFVAIPWSVHWLKTLAIIH